MMAWEAKQKGYSCNDCYLSMQNCKDMRICCEDETGLCDWFEEIPKEDAETMYYPQVDGITLTII